jgi:hypothetical protein
VGLGAVQTRSGDLYGFHCTEIADGSRDIAIGAQVAFLVGAGHAGTWEAKALVTVTRATITQVTVTQSGKNDRS